MTKNWAVGASGGGARFSGGEIKKDNEAEGYVVGVGDKGDAIKDNKIECGGAEDKVGNIVKVGIGETVSVIGDEMEKNEEGLEGATAGEWLFKEG